MNAYSGPRVYATPPITGPNSPPIVAMAINLPDISPNFVGQISLAAANPAVNIAAPDKPWISLAIARMINPSTKVTLIAIR